MYVIAIYPKTIITAAHTYRYQNDL